MSRNGVAYSTLQPSDRPAPSPDFGAGLISTGDSLLRLAGQKMREQDEINERLRRASLSEFESRVSLDLHTMLAESQVESEQDDGSGLTMLERFQKLSADRVLSYSEGITDPEQKQIVRESFNRLSSAYHVGAVQAAAKMQQARALDLRQQQIQQAAAGASAGHYPPEVAIAMQGAILDQMIEDEQILPGDADASRTKFRTDLLNGIGMRLLADDPDAAMAYLDRYGDRMDPTDYAQIRSRAESRIAQRPYDKEIKASDIQRSWNMVNTGKYDTPVQALDAMTPFLNQIKSIGGDVDQYAKNWLMGYVGTAMLDADGEEVASQVIGRLQESFPEARNTMLEVTDMIERSQQAKINEANRQTQRTARELDERTSNKIRDMLGSSASIADIMPIIDAAAAEAESLNLDAAKFGRDRLKPIIDHAAKRMDASRLDEIERLLDASPNVDSVEVRTEIIKAREAIQRFTTSNEWMTTQKRASQYAQSLSAGNRPSVDSATREAEYRQYLATDGKDQPIEARLERYSHNVPEDLMKEVMAYAPGGWRFNDDPYRFAELTMVSGVDAGSMKERAAGLIGGAFGGGDNGNRALMDVYMTVAPVASTNRGGELAERFEAVMRGGASAGNLQSLAGWLFAGDAYIDPDGEKIDPDPMTVHQVVAASLGLDPEDLIGTSNRQYDGAKSWLSFLTLVAKNENPADGVKGWRSDALESLAEVSSQTTGLMSVGNILDREYVAYDKTLFAVDGRISLEAVEEYDGAPTHRNVPLWATKFGSSGFMAPYAFRYGREVATPLVDGGQNRTAVVADGYHLLNLDTLESRWVSRLEPEADSLENVSRWSRSGASIMPVVLNIATNRYGAKSVFSIPEHLGAIRSNVANSIFAAAMQSEAMDNIVSGNTVVQDEAFIAAVRLRADTIARQLGYPHGLGSTPEEQP